MNERILCVGLLVADVVVRPADSMPMPGTSILVEDLALVAGGCAANCASVLAKLGMSVAVAGQIGTDRLGDSVLADLKAVGVDVSTVRRTEKYLTSAVIGLIESSGERSFLCRPGANEQLTDDVIPDSLFDGVRIVHIGGAMKLVNLDIASVLRRASEAGCITTLDTDWDARGVWIEHLRPALPHVRVLMTNEMEGRMLTGEEDTQAIGRSLLAFGPQVVVVKQGAGGSTAVTAQGSLHVAAFRVPVIDTTCAGDSFAAGFLYGLAHEWPLRANLAFANAVGALCTTRLSHHGVTSLSAVMQLLEDQLGEGSFEQLLTNQRSTD
ncbi:MAG: carbohydrate kinase family protein [Fimbriimonadia bacterium]